MQTWYQISNISEVDSPALVIYKSRVMQNINTAISMVGDVRRLRPHVKTHKSKEAALLMMDAGIHKFKCATIAEAEMLGMVSAPDVLLAYQPLGPKLSRFISLIKTYPQTIFSCLVDNIDTAGLIAAAATRNNIEIPIFVDLNVGMNRTGIEPAKAADLYEACNKIAGLITLGLHAYDGQLRSPDIQQRSIDCNKAFEKVIQVQQQLQQRGFNPIVIAGGSPTFLSSTVGSEAWNSRDLKSRPH